jgi:hypothetical protein
MANIDYNALTQKLTDQLNAMRAEIPFLTDPRPKSDLRKLSNAAHVSDAFVEQLGGVLTGSGALAGSIPVDVPGMVDKRRFTAALALFENQLRAFADSIHATLIVVRHESGTSALVAYAAAQTLVRLPGGQDLTPHVRNLRRVLGRGPAKRADKAPDPAPAPASETPSTTS